VKRAARIRAETSTRTSPARAPARAQARAIASRTRFDAALACAVFLASFAVYANTLGHGFVWDDLIVLDSRVRFYRSPLDAFIEPADLPGFPAVFRPLTFTSF
jgi:hypothetical protein